MQTAKNAAATAKESAANVAASAKSGKDKTKATVQEKVERMTAHDPTQKDMATRRKQEKIQQAQFSKQEAMENNAAARQAIASGGTANFTAVGGTQAYNPGGDGLNTHTRPTGGPNPVNLTGSNPPGYGTGQQTHNTGTGLGGVDAVYPNDRIESGPNQTRHANAAGGRAGPGINPGGPNDGVPGDGAPGTGYGTGGTYQ